MKWIDDLKKKWKKRSKNRRTEIQLYDLDEEHKSLTIKQVIFHYGVMVGKLHEKEERIRQLEDELMKHKTIEIRQQKRDLNSREVKILNFIKEAKYNDKKHLIDLLSKKAKGKKAIVPKSTAYRILSALEKRNILQIDGDKYIINEYQDY